MRHNERFTLKLDHGHADLFLAMHGDLFPHVRPWPKLHPDCRPQVPIRATCTGPMPDWRRTSVFVEIHEHSEIAWRAIETKLDALRRRYAEAGGRLLTIATLRDPERQLQSLYRQQPPAAALASSAFRSLVPEAGRAVNGSSTFDDDFRKTTFEDWLHFNGGFTTRTLIWRDDDMKAALKEEASRTPQAAYLSRQRLIFPSTMTGPPCCFNYSCPLAAQERAKEHLRRFDLVGDLEDLESLVANATGALLGVPRSRVRLRHLQYSIGTSATKVKAVARQVASELELPRVRALLADVARCDREVWREAVALHPQMLARLWSGTLPWDRDIT